MEKKDVNNSSFGIAWLFKVPKVELIINDFKELYKVELFL